ncbi:MAG: DNA replication/repair protein RecF [Prevotellaceae bacterium]|jgi:DNA replication and repair protein RecF|nr:DNA replication/repair protein RecF [Prevotellaceae bacterium]
MFLQSVSILNYKNIEEANLVFSPQINCFIGNNGMGKTNLLDAIYYLSFCKSHLHSIDNQNIRHDADFFMLNGKYVFAEADVEADLAATEISCGLKRRQRKQFRCNKKEYDKLSDHIGLLPLVLISPADVALIAEGSNERRKFVDGVISQYDKPYLNKLLAYNNALSQRNSLLKAEIMDNSLLEILEMQMADNGNYIFEKRNFFLENFAPVFQEFYNKISAETEQVTLKYQSQYNSTDNILEKMRTARERDKILGFSTVGIHKDDLEFLLNSFPIKTFGSQGQCKTFVIALKLAQFAFLIQTNGFAPLLLLDDIFDKLDGKRVERIVEIVSEKMFGQIFITDTNRKHLDEILRKKTDNFQIFYVEHGVAAAEA